MQPVSFFLGCLSFPAADQKAAEEQAQIHNEAMLWDNVYAEINTKNGQKLFARVDPMLPPRRYWHPSLQSLDDYEIEKLSEGRIDQEMIKKCS